MLSLDLAIPEEIRVERSAQTSLSGRLASGNSNPQTLSEFDCLAINIIGPEIPYRPVYSSANISCGWGGITSQLIDLQTSPSFVQMDFLVPSGPSRTIQLLGIVSPQGCPHQSLNDFLGSLPQDAYTQGYRILLMDSVTINLFQDQPVTLSATHYDPNRMMDQFLCSSSQSQVKYNEYVYVASGATIYAMKLDPTNGALTDIAGANVTLVGSNFKSLLSYTNRSGQRFLMATTNDSKVMSFAVSATTGALATVNTISHVAAGGDNLNLLAAVPYGGGGFLYALPKVGQLSTPRLLYPASISAETGALTQISNIGLTSDSVDNPLQSAVKSLQISQSGGIAYAPSTSGSGIDAYSIDSRSGNFTFSANNGAAAVTDQVAMDPLGIFIYTIDKNNGTADQTVRGFQVMADGSVSRNSVSGDWTNEGRGAVYSLAPHPKSPFVFAIAGGAGGGNHLVIPLMVSSSGLRVISGSYSTGGSEGKYGAVDPSGAYLLVLNTGLTNNANTVGVMAINPTTGIPGSPVSHAINTQTATSIQVVAVPAQ